jgi:hypothetical protein
MFQGMVRQYDLQHVILWVYWHNVCHTPKIKHLKGKKRMQIIR